MRKSICIITTRNTAGQMRVLRQIQYLGLYYDILLIGSGPPPAFLDQTRIKYHQLSHSSSGLINSLIQFVKRYVITPLIPRALETYRIALENKCDAYYAHDWMTLPPAAEAARRNNAKLLLDIHEDYSAWLWGLYAPIVKSVFRKYGKQVNASTTVVSQIAERHKQFHLDPIVIMNAPVRVDLPSRQFDPNKIQLIHLGSATPERKPEIMIQTIAQCDHRYKLNLMFVNNDSSFVRRLKIYAEDIAPGRVEFHDPVSPMLTIQKISAFDVGFYPLVPTNYNNLFALPNKFFDFIAAGLAVCIGPSPAMAEIVQKYHCGCVSKTFKPEDIAVLLNQTTPKQWIAMRQAALDASRYLNADIEMRKEVELCASLLFL